MNQRKKWWIGKKKKAAELALNVAKKKAELAWKCWPGSNRARPTRVYKCRHDRHDRDPIIVCGALGLRPDGAIITFFVSVLKWLPQSLAFQDNFFLRLFFFPSSFCRKAFTCKVSCYMLELYNDKLLDLFTTSKGEVRPNKLMWLCWCVWYVEKYIRK